MLIVQPVHPKLYCLLFFFSCHTDTHLVSLFFLVTTLRWECQPLGVCDRKWHSQGHRGHSVWQLWANRGQRITAGMSHFTLDTLKGPFILTIFHRKQFYFYLEESHWLLLSLLSDSWPLTLECSIESLKNSGKNTCFAIYTRQGCKKEKFH